MTVCPVCDLQIDDAEALEQGLSTEYGGVFYYFCSQQCKECFDNNPVVYIDQLYQRRSLEDAELGLYG